MSAAERPVRADIVQTGDPLIRAVTIEIDAPANRIFDVIAQPAMHCVVDGSGTVRGRLNGPDRLFLGAKFGMRMRIGLPYVIRNEVIEFEEDRRIAWRHVNRHVWRYEFTPLDEHRTRVTETFDGTTSRFPAGLQVMKAYQANELAMAKTLVNLKALMELDGKA
jgi:hypothetical protein